MAGDRRGVCVRACAVVDKIFLPLQSSVSFAAAGFDCFMVVLSSTTLSKKRKERRKEWCRVFSRLEDRRQGSFKGNAGLDYFPFFTARKGGSITQINANVI